MDEPAPTEGMTEARETDPPSGVASDIPNALYWPLWIGAFFVILWGMNLLFGRNRTPPPAAPTGDPDPPVLHDRR